MRKYYIVLARDPNTAHIIIKLTDNCRGYEVLHEIEASSYAEAYKRVTFEKTINGETSFI